jgi:ubiquinone/menaquinone biosynthesis C-methylase UbiE
MDAVKQIFNSPEHVDAYEEKTKRALWMGPEILFGLAFRHINSGEKVLDLGIGTGLISELFHKAGTQVYGMDFSSEMLKACEKKNIAAELNEHDLRETPYPYDDNSMDHAVCGGVMHIFKNIRMIFKEVSRIVKPGGTFAFASGDRHASTAKKSSVGMKVSIPYNHDQAEIEMLLDAHGFALLNSLEFFVYMQGDKSRKHAYRAYSAKNAGE